MNSLVEITLGGVALAALFCVFVFIGIPKELNRVEIERSVNCAYGYQGACQEIIRLHGGLK